MKHRVRNLESGQIEYVETPDSPRIEVTHRPDANPPSVLDQQDLTTLYLNATHGPQPRRLYRVVPVPEQPNKVKGVLMALGLIAGCIVALSAILYGIQVLS